MKRNWTRNKMAVIIATAAFMMAGCQSNAGNSAETKALKEQVAHLEQQISDLEQLLASGKIMVSDPTTDGVQGQTGDMSDNNVQDVSDANIDSEVQMPTDADTTNNTQSQNDIGSGNDTQFESGMNAGNGSVSGHDESIYHNSSHAAVNGNASEQQGVSGTTYTMEELNSLVDTFVTKANAAVPSGDVSQDMEQFFALKQEEKQIDDLLDQHEDELEYLYKRQSLTREDYKRLERQLDLLDDKLGAAEDQLELVFGIDD